MKHRIVMFSQISRCPMLSLDPSHYTDDGCKCDTAFAEQVAAEGQTWWTKEVEHVKDGILSASMSFTLRELHELRRSLELREVDISAKIDAERRYPVTNSGTGDQARLIDQYVVNRSLHTWACERIMEVEKMWMEAAQPIPEFPGWTPKT